MKPPADEVRRMPPLRVTERAARPDEPKHRRRCAVVRLIYPTAELMPVAIDRAAGGDQSAGQAWEYMDRPAARASIPPLAARCAARLNGFPGALAVVPRHRIANRRQRVSDTSATGLSDARLVGEPAYPPWPRFARPRRELAGGCAPSDPHIANGAS